jgi:uncharacterized oxidoreductase
MQIAGKLALVTGGTDGIGVEIARKLQVGGAQVVVAARSPDRLERARLEGFEAIAADLSNAQGCDELCAAFANRPLDLLVNNAGTDPEFNVAKPIDPAVLDRAIFLNLNAPIRLIAILLPILRARPEAVIVNVTSGLAIAPGASTPVYSGTKAGLRSFTLALRAQLKDSLVQVIEALPPLVDTTLTTSIASKSKMPPTICAAAIVEAIESGLDEVNIGDVRMLRRIYSLSPALARRIMIAS